MIREGLHWYTAKEFAVEWNKDDTTVRKWCKNGFLISAGFKLQRDINGRWLIADPTKTATSAISATR